MPPRQSLPATRRVRKSISGSPSKATDQENATIDMGSNNTSGGGGGGGGLASTAAASRKKSRSKSMGPGGVDALKASTGNRRQSLAATAAAAAAVGGDAARPLPRSILKPTMPILQDIPPLKTKAKPQTRTSASPSATMRIALRTEEEQQAAAREREREERERAAREKQVHDHREARRKSLANRRVSFAAEATLHTFHEIEYMQDSTTSTDSTAATAARRASMASMATTTTPQQQAEQSTNPFGAYTPVASPFQPASMDDDNQTLTSTVYDSDDDDNDNDNEGEEEDEEEEVLSDSGGDSDSDEGDGATMVTVDADESTSASVLSAISALSGRSASPIESTSDLDEALRLATQHAGAQADRARRQQRPLDEDEELIPAFAGWGKKAAPTTREQNDDDNEDDNDTAMSMDMDMTSAMGGIVRSTPAPQQTDSTEMQMEMSMDVTRVYGGILLPPPPETTTTAMTPGPNAAENESVASSPMILASEDGNDNEAEPTVVGEAPMELTTVMGGVLVGAGAEEAGADSASLLDNESLEDMSMELTTVLGGVLGGGGLSSVSQTTTTDGSPSGGTTRRPPRPSLAQAQRRLSQRLSRRQSMRAQQQQEEEEAEEEEEADAPMDMTVAVGTILAQDKADKAETADSPAEMDVDMDMDMEMTTALGGIVRPVPAPAPVPASVPSTPKRASPVREMIGSRSKSPKSSKSPKRAGRSTTPQSAAKSPPKAAARSPFTRSVMGTTAPSVVLTPQRQKKPQTKKSPPRTQQPEARSALDAGPASPKITAIFNRRSSLADSAAAFVVGSAEKERENKGVTFSEPSPPSRPRPGTPDGREVTQNLKELIDNLSPKKAASSSSSAAAPKRDNPFRGRKSLHVGSARGLLGKRPLELDEDEDEEGGGGGGRGMSSEDDDEATLESQAFVKRLRVGGDGEPSPVKSIRLQQPPSAMETIGRSSRTRRPSFSPPAVVPGTPADEEASGTMDTTATATATATTDGEKDDGDDDNDKHIHLQDFLKLANIHFMELETTKRRATKAPGSFGDEHHSSGGHGQGDGHGQGHAGPRLSTDEAGRPKDAEVEALVTSVCKVPLLEMYQHACRELKNYIEEGRSIMREIEAATYEDNPPIFREYTLAAPAMRAQMDQQFKNIKMFARLQSKKQWYEWRAKLHQGLQEGLRKTLGDLEADRAALAARRAAVDGVYPLLADEARALEAERARLAAAVARLGGDGRGLLVQTRGKTRQLQQAAVQSRATAAQLAADTAASRARVAAMKEEREALLQALADARRLQEERRRWSHQEISSLRAQVDALERQSGWAVTGAAGTTLTLAYRGEVAVAFDVAWGGGGRPIEVWAMMGERTTTTTTTTTDAATDFFLQAIRDQVRKQADTTTHPAALLRTVRASWDVARRALRQLRLLGLAFPTATRRTTTTTADDTTTAAAALAVDVSVLVAALRTKLAVTVHVRVGDSSSEKEESLSVGVSADVRVVYGEPFHTAKMGEFLSTRLAGRASRKTGSAGEAWADVVEELKGKLVAQGCK